MELTWRRQVNSNAPNMKAAVVTTMKRNKVRIDRSDAVSCEMKLTIQMNKVACTWRGVNPASIQVLCPTCRSLKLSAEKFIVIDHSQPRHEAQASQAPQIDASEAGKFDIGSGSSKCELGTLWAIRMRSGQCPLCRLVLKSLQEQPHTGLLAIGADTDVGEEKEALKTICSASWQIDGRELIRDQSGNVTATRARTRRIRLHWDAGGFQDSYIVLVAPHPWATSGLFLGRHVESARTNPSLVKSWIELCHNSHGTRCKIERGPDFRVMLSESYFGVVDVDDMCLVSLPVESKYIALSYTWGTADIFRTTSENIKVLQVGNGIDKIFSALPRAIQDTIVLVRELGERYLWVDSLCIVQDSRESWDLNARVMDLVYGNAHLTVCAADGDNADVGLVGLSPSERYFTQHIEEYAPGVRLMVSHLAETYIQRSTWNTRAWTFQERLLSKRCLIFTEGRVYFQCRSTAMCEDIIAEQKEAGWSIELVNAPLQLLSDLENRALQVYRESVELYTSRILSYENDILSAFNGIGNMVGKALGSSLLYGLPNSHFDWALLWEPQDSPQPRNRKKFPSWSWCGWIGETIEYKRSMMSGSFTNIHEWLMDHTWIIWYIRDGHGSLRLVWNSSRQSDKYGRSDHRWKGYSAISKDDKSIDPYGRSIKAGGSELPCSSFFRTLPEYPYGVSVRDRNSEPDIKLPDLRFLQFWTWSATLRLKHEDQSSSSNLGRKFKRFGIADYKGDWCGTIVLDQSWSQKLNSSTEQEFIAISEAKAFSEEEYDGWTYYIPTERDQSEWDLYYVLMIEHKGEIAYRVGLGKVFKEAFSNSCAPGKQWKEFILG